MKYSFELTKADLNNYFKRMPFLTQSKSKLTVRLILALISGSCFLIMKFGLMIAGIVISIIILLLTFSIKKGFFIILGPKQALPLHATIEVTEQGIIYENNKGSSLFEWQSITQFEDSNDYFYFRFRKKLVSIVPKRTFTSEAELVAFREFIKSKMGSAPMEKERASSLNKIRLLFFIFLVIVAVISFLKG